MIKKEWKRLNEKKENICVMDREYLNYEQFLEITHHDIYFVSRLKEPQGRASSNLVLGTFFMPGWRNW